MDFLKEDLGVHKAISTQGLPTTYYWAAYNQESKLERKWVSLNKTLSFLKELFNILNVLIKGIQFYMLEALTSQVYFILKYQPIPVIKLGEKKAFTIDL